MATKEEHRLTVEALVKMGKHAHYVASSSEQRAMIAVLEEQGQEALKVVINAVPHHQQQSRHDNFH